MAKKIPGLGAYDSSNWRVQEERNRRERQHGDKVTILVDGQLREVSRSAAIEHARLQKSQGK